VALFVCTENIFVIFPAVNGVVRCNIGLFSPVLKFMLLKKISLVRKQIKKRRRKINNLRKEGVR
jgi:hypothetical protein